MDQQSFKKKHGTTHRFGNRKRKSPMAKKNPYSIKRNLTYSIPNEDMNLFLKRAVCESAINFHEPQVTVAIDLIRENMRACPCWCADNSEFEANSDSHQEESQTLDDEGGSEYGSKSPSAKPHRRKEASTITGASQFVQPGPPMAQQNIERLSRLSKEDLDYQFTRETLSNGREPQMICSFCMEKGHLKEGHCSALLALQFLSRQYWWMAALAALGRLGREPQPGTCLPEPRARAGGSHGPREEKRWGRSLCIDDERGPDACRRHPAIQLHIPTSL
ncbi:uncharacterized protein LOC115313773 [Ixodes scapularis]|uniref:uncharacterized protein LOC115313773 n=1 Tax=Ixodes scapularis TaxID=6945 RepID=UPI001C380D89|nr:uncharacterized protein LOC115313773 [Ixodes scapularis]